MTRKIKFRAWHKNLLEMQNDVHLLDRLADIISRPETYEVMQFTGLKDKNGKEIYESDIQRITLNDGYQNDLVYYSVCTWIKEWCMFAWLHVDEYNSYLKNGASALDTSMYWTYPVDEDETNSISVCGNIYTHPQFL